MLFWNFTLSDSKNDDIAESSDHSDVADEDFADVDYLSDDDDFYRDEDAFSDDDDDVTEDVKCGAKVVAGLVMGGGKATGGEYRIVYCFFVCVYPQLKKNTLINKVCKND